jgi:hypothetical protein
MNQTANALTVTDGFSDSDPSASPVRGTSIRFVDRAYVGLGGDKFETKNKSFAVLDRRQGWQKLVKKTCPPEYLMRAVGQPKPQQPFVDKKAWPLDFNKQPAHPWKWTEFLYLVNTDSGEFVTFSSSTAGGGIAVRELADQVSLMRNVRPNAIPVVELSDTDMPTQYNSTKPRPFFKLLGWKTRDAEQPQLVDMAKPTLKEEMGGDEVPEKDWAAKGDPLANLDAPKASPTKKKKK